MRRVVVTVLVLAVLAAVVAVVGRHLGQRTANNLATQVATATAAYGPLVVSVSDPGVVQAATSVNVVPQTNGVVATLPIQVGDHVRAGQVLATLTDNGQIANAVLAAKAQLANDEAALTALLHPTPPTQAQIRSAKERIATDQSQLASDEANLDALLHPTPPTAAQIAAAKARIATDEAALAADQANLYALEHPTPPTQQSIAAQQARIAADQARLEQDQATLQYTTVTAPVAGLVESVTATVGQVVGTGTPLLEIAAGGSFDVSTAIPETDLSQISTGVPATVTLPDGTNVSAAVQSIGTTATPSTSIHSGPTIPVTLSLENPQALVVSGAVVAVSIPSIYFTGSGTVQPADMVSVEPQISGTVTNVLVSPGQSVTPGQALVDLSSPSLTTTVAQDESTLATDQSTLYALLHPTPATAQQIASATSRLQADQVNLASDEANLTSLLHPTPPTAAQIASAKARIVADTAAEAADQANLDALLHPTPPTAAQIAADEARIASDRATLAQDTAQLADLTIRSPISGVVTAVNAQVGAPIGSGNGSGAAAGSAASSGGGSAAFTIENPGLLQVVATVNETDIRNVELGERARVTVNALPGQFFAGTVTGISPTGNNSQGVATFNVTVTLERPAPALKPGMSATVSILVAVLPHVLLVPAEAVTGVGPQATVQVLQGRRIETVRVDAGLSNDVATEILSGLAPGEKVVTAYAATTTVPQGRGGFGFFGGGFRRDNGGAGGGAGSGGPAGGAPGGGVGNQPGRSGGF